MTLLYFSFTSLSTVGLGDYHPRSDFERAVGAFLLLFGVTVTSYVTECVIMMAEKIKIINASLEEKDKLNMFLSTLNRFN